MLRLCGSAPLHRPFPPSPPSPLLPTSLDRVLPRLYLRTQAVYREKAERDTATVAAHVARRLAALGRPADGISPGGGWNGLEWIGMDWIGLLEWIGIRVGVGMGAAEGFARGFAGAGEGG